MKFLKGILFGLLGLVLLLTIISFFLPSTVQIERSATINAPAEQIFAQINDFKNWPKWMAWAEMDPNMTYDFEAVTAGTGAGYCWKSEEVGNGCMKIKESIANSSMKTEIDFGGQGKGQGSWTLEAADGGTKVTWGMESSVSSPPVIGKYFGLMMDGMVGPSFDKGLANIKKIVE